MVTGKKKKTKSISLKKETYQQLATQLTTSLGWLKEILGEKKFESRIKKSAKLLSNGIKQKTLKKINPGKKKAETSEPIGEN